MQQNTLRYEAPPPGQRFLYRESLAAALATHAQPHFCYANVWHALRGLTALQEAMLVEGWVVIASPGSVHVIEHCWCELSGRGIIDPSLVLLLGEPIPPVCFFAGARRARQEIAAISCEQLPLVRTAGPYGADGQGHPGYRRAYELAFAQAMRLASAMNPPAQITVEPALAPAQPIQQPIRFTVQIVSSQAFRKGAR